MWGKFIVTSDHLHWPENPIAVSCFMKESRWGLSKLICCQQQVQVTGKHQTSSLKYSGWAFGLQARVSSLLTRNHTSKACVCLKTTHTHTHKGAHTYLHRHRQIHTRTKLTAPLMQGMQFLWALVKHLFPKGFWVYHSTDICFRHCCQ